MLNNFYLNTFWCHWIVDSYGIVLILQGPLSESLRLISCNLVSNEGFIEAVKELPLLEELELSLCPNVGGFFVSNDVCGYEVYKFVSEVCPQLSTSD